MLVSRPDIAHSVTRGAFYLAIEKVAALVSGTIFFVVMLRLLGPTKYGLMTLALSIVALATMATGNFEMFLERYAAEYHAHDRLLTLRRAQRLSLALKLGLGVIAGLGLIAFAPLLAHQFGAPELGILLPLLAVTVAGDGFATTGRAVMYGLQRFREMTLLSVLFHVAKIALVCSLWFMRQGLVGLTVGLAAITLAFGIAQTVVPLWMLRHARDADASASTPEPGSMLRSILAYCTPLMGARITFLTGQNLGKVVLGKLFAPALLGYYSFAFQTIERFVELVYILPASLLPSLTQLVARGERGRLRLVFDRSHRLIQIASCAVSLVLFVFAREITLLVGSPLFEPAIPVLRLLALVPLARTAQLPLAMLFQALRLPGTVLTLDLLKFVVEFGSYFVLIPWLGLNGAGLANVLGAFVAYVIALWLLARTFPEGASERRGTVLQSLALFAPALLAGWLADVYAPPAWSLGLRVAIVVLALLGVFAFGLVNRPDLERFSQIPLASAWMQRTRDALVAIARGLTRFALPRSAS